MHLINTYSTTKNLTKSIFYALPMALFLLVFLTNGNITSVMNIESIPFWLTYNFFSVSYFLMLYTGKTDKFRAIIFILFAVFLSVSFMTNMLEMRGTLTYNEAGIFECDIPFCHMVIPMLIIPAALTKTIIFPGSIIGGFASISSMLALWFFSSLALGRGFCSWGCFYGGWDEGFSRIRKKSIIKNIPPYLRWTSFAVLLLVAITAASALSPTYCDWICPFKAVTEYEAVTSVKSLIKAIIFISLFLGLVIIIPLLSKKRTQCALFCPLGALQTGFNKINVFDIKIDKDKCTDCKKCTKICPMYSLDGNQIDKGKPDFTCSKCGKCIDACPQKAVHYHIKGTSTAKRKTLKRNIFLFAAFLFLALFASGSYISAIDNIINWIF